MTFAGRTTFRRFVAEDGGVAAAEFAIWLVVLVPLILNVVDMGVFVYRRMQVENASQMGAQTAWVKCPSPSTTVCNVDAAVDAAIQSTSLSTDVSRSGAVMIGQYCPVVATRTLVAQTTVCANGASPGWYAIVTATYNYLPVFPGVTVSSLLPSTITQTSWSRLE